MQEIDEILKQLECRRPDCNGGHLMEQHEDGTFSDYAQCQHCYELDVAKRQLTALISREIDEVIGDNEYGNIGYDGEEMVDETSEDMLIRNDFRHQQRQRKQERGW